MSKVSAKIIKPYSDEPIKKAENPTALSDETNNGITWINHPVDMRGYRALVNQSAILPQCIRAYKDNIAGFGIDIRYIDDADDSNAEAKAEWDMLKRVIDLLSLDMDTKEVFEDIVESRETYGIAYLEVIRNPVDGLVNQVEFIKDVETIFKTIPLPPFIKATYYYKNEEITRLKKFRQYKQEKNGKTVYFKEFGDPRIMDYRSGEYEKSVPPEFRANEILEFAIGTDDYGMVRWNGQILGVEGARKAENLNNNYFENGRHTPLAVIVSGGTISEDSEKRLQQYMNDIKGESGQHSFLLLEVEDSEERPGFDENRVPSIELKDMASILQKDELFQDYIDNSRKKVQSAFRLPDLYTGYTTDFNRATSQTAMEITEKQVFQPERKSLAWIINNKLLNGYNLKYVEVYFKAPDITNPDDIAKLLNISERAGGVTPNMAKQITYDVMAWRDEQDFSEEWGDIPLAVQKEQNATANQSAFSNQLEQEVTKSALNSDAEVVGVMKEVKRLLLKMKGDGNSAEG